MIGQHVGFYQQAAPLDACSRFPGRIGLSDCRKTRAGIMTGRVANSKRVFGEFRTNRNVRERVADGIRLRMIPVFFNNQGVLRLRS